MKWLKNRALSKSKGDKINNFAIPFVFYRMLINFADPKWEEFIMIFKEQKNTEQ